jgi:hypothetical protein
MQYGTVPVVSSTGGLVDTVKEGITGFHMGAFDPDKLNQADADAIAATVQRASQVCVRLYGNGLVGPLVQLRMDGSDCLLKCSIFMYLWFFSLAHVLPCTHRSVHLLPQVVLHTFAATVMFISVSVYYCRHTPLASSVRW